MPEVPSNLSMVGIAIGIGIAIENRFSSGSR